jgi:hypothetical protein
LLVPLQGESVQRWEVVLENGPNQAGKRDIQDIEPNHSLQQTGHANDGLSCFSVLPA